MKFRWSLQAQQPALATNLAAAVNVPPLVAQCLINRGFSDPEITSNFLQPKLKNLADPFLLPDMNVAVERLIQARQAKEPVVIFGDYDVDGVTSTTLLLHVFKSLGLCVNAYLPHRMDEGYGLTLEAVDNCLRKFPVRLLVAVDCGSTSVEPIEVLRQRGIDVIVLDHHQVSTPAPKAVALVNPQRGDKFRELCSAGLAFKLAHALIKRLRDQGDATALGFDVRPLLDLVALGTIADIVPLIGENRVFATRGLDVLSSSQRPGIRALKAVAQTGDVTGAHEVGFQLAPRLNAAGRLETAEQALQLLLAQDIAEAEPLATSLDACNRERQRIEKNISEEVIAAVRARFNAETDYVIVEGQTPWHIGVVGIVASRVVQEFYRPTFIVGGEGEHWRGSGRSIEGFDLAAALRECTELLVRHGGHAMAAGVTVHPDNLPAFRTRLNDLARRLIKSEDLKPRLRLDAEVTLADLSLEMVEALEMLKPAGPSNPSVQVVVRGVSHQRPPQRMGKDNQHVKFRVTDGVRIVDAVWWNCGDAPLPKVMFDLACAPQINEYNGRRSVQLKVLDWQSVA